MWLWIRIACYLILAVINIGYGTFVKHVGAGNTFYRIWYLIGAVFLLLIPCAYGKLWSRLGRAFKIVLISLIVLGLALLTTVECLVASRFQTEEADVDYILVLGAQWKEDGPSVVLSYRLETALRYLNGHPDVRCIVSGGMGDNEPISEAEGMYRYLTEHGISADRLIREERSVNTAENFAYSIPLLPSKDTSVGIVTNNFHMYRALGIARKSGLTNVSAVVAPSTEKYLPHNMLREFFGIMKDFVFGNFSW